MTRTFKTVKASIIMGLLLFSLFTVFMPTSSAGLINLTPNMIISYDESATNQVITPLETTLHIPIYVQFQVSGPLVFLNNIPEYLNDNTGGVSIDITVESAPSFCSASMSTSSVLAPIEQNLKYATNSSLIVTVNENAPGFDDFTVRIKARSKKVTGLIVNVPEIETVHDVRVKPSYAALISIEVPKGNFLEIGPMDTADFEIKVENLGNAPTEVTFELINIPEGWNPNIQETVTLGSGVLGDDSTKTVPLRVKPPFGFGYHNEIETVQVKVTPSYYRNPTLEGREYVLNFQIQSRGFSTPGFEGALLIIALVGVIGFISYKKRKK